MQKKRIEHVKSHFDEEAVIFDERVVKIVPYYDEMLEALVTAIPFAPIMPIRVADLGCGTGAAAYLVKKRFPKARVLCVDMSQNMLDIASEKLRGMKGVEFALSELGGYRFKGSYDAIVSSLALHHIASGRGKTAVYRSIYAALKKGGIFVNADNVNSGEKKFQEKYLEKWAEFVLRSSSKKHMHENYERYKREDRPAVLLDDIDTLKKIGFRAVDVFWKYYNFAVYCAVKR